jgi:PmbA protein
MHKGLYVTDVLGLHTANPITGDFSVGASGFLVENGAIKHGVKGITIAGNFHQLFQRITAVGSDLKFRGSTGSPSLLVEEIAISGD